jgi:ABC-type Fe3+ transport system substrate-binding protein
MFLRRRKSKRAKAASLAGDYLKLEAAGKVARGAGKTAGNTAKTVVAYKGTKGVAKRWPWIAGFGAAIAAAVVGAKALRGGGGEPATG